MSAVYEIVPNISEGRSSEIVDACAAAIVAAGARVIDRTSDAAHNRSVLTAVGSREEVLAAALALAGVAAERIDLREHDGLHPRMGALDVLPFVPLRDATIEDAADLAREAARAIWEQHGVPAFMYGEAATAPHRRNLADVRRGEFEGLSAKIDMPQWKPDFGDAAHPSAGAIAVGARRILIAFNVDLETGDLSIARAIAHAMRERDGGLRTLRALAIPLRSDCVQVSFNVTDTDAVPLYRIVELVRALAAERGIAIERSELIGMLPRSALARTAAYYLGEAAG